MREGVSSIRLGAAWIAVSLALASPVVAAPAPGAELTGAIASGLRRVEEFEYIRKKAGELGIRVWLFGGTAAGLAHYAHWDVQRQQGEARFDAERFDYHYTNIYRSNQDIDLVVDGPLDAAEKLEQLLQNELGHLAGIKLQWEVRMLRERRGDKEPLLGTDDFISQHSDSNSIGLVEITDPPKGEPRVRDLRSWNSSHGIFLRDIEAGKVSYLYSDRHAETARAKQGKNPALLSAIRFVIKAAQFRLQVSDEDRARVKKVVQAFDSRKDQADAYVPYWLEKNSRKIFLNAVDLDYAARLIDDVGMRRLLVGLGNKNVADTSAWWLNRVPLPDRPLATSGRTAAELNLTEVAHETVDFRAYESITAAPSGEPNVLISRNDAVGEAAVHGNGFYTQVGHHGARGTGWTIRFQMDPNAREGVDADFSLVNGGHFVVVHNRRAFRVIPESLALTPSQYFEMLRAGRTAEAGDLAIFARMERRVLASLPLLSVDSEEYHKIQAIVEDVITRGKRNAPVIDAWLKIPAATQDMEGRLLRLWEATQRGARLSKKDRWLVKAGLQMNLGAMKDPAVVNWAVREMLDKLHGDLSDLEMIAIFKRVRGVPEASQLLAERMLTDRVPELWLAVSRIGFAEEARPELRGLLPRIIQRAQGDQSTRRYLITHFFTNGRDADLLASVLPLIGFSKKDPDQLAIAQSLAPGKFGEHEDEIVRRLIGTNHGEVQLELGSRATLSDTQVFAIVDSLIKNIESEDAERICGEFLIKVQHRYPHLYEAATLRVIDWLAKGPAKIQEKLSQIGAIVLRDQVTGQGMVTAEADLRLARRFLAAANSSLPMIMLEWSYLAPELVAPIYEKIVEQGSDSQRRALLTDRSALGMPGIQTQEKALGRLIEGADHSLLNFLSAEVFKRPVFSAAEAARLAPFLASVIRYGDDRVFRTLLENTFTQAPWQAHPELLADLIRRASLKTLAVARSTAVFGPVLGASAQGEALRVAMKQSRYSERSRTLAAAGLGEAFTPAHCLFLEVRRLIFDRGSR